jgi:hypothetical protein
MKILDEIRDSDKKPKELVTFLAEEVKKDGSLMDQVVKCIIEGSIVEKGTCAEVMEKVTKDKPELAIKHIEGVMEYINYEAPRVKWEISRVVANVSKEAPDKVAKAIPKLLKNTEDKSSVVRWCAAFALTEIAKNNPDCRNELNPKLIEIIKKEKNNGVKNVYSKAFKKLKNIEN